MGTGGGHVMLQCPDAGIVRQTPQQAICKGAPGFRISRQPLLSRTVSPENFRMLGVCAIPVKASRMHPVRRRRFWIGFSSGDLGPCLRFQCCKVLPSALGLGLTYTRFRQGQEGGSRVGDGDS